MRFRLVEEPTQTTPKAEWPPSNRTLKAYDKLETIDERTKFIQERIFPHKIFKNLFGVQSIIMDSIQRFGLDPTRNFFLNFVSNLNVSMSNAKSKPKLQYIYSSYLNKKLDLRMEVLQNPTLYDRSDRDFQYTLNAFHLFESDDRGGVYIKDTSIVDTSEFLVSGNDFTKSEIKAAGLNGQKGDTIFNVIESWADNNEYSPQEIADRKLQKEKEDAEKEKSKKNGNTHSTIQDRTITWDFNYFEEEIEKAFANQGKIFLPLTNKDEYINRLFATFKLPNLPPLNLAQQKTPHIVNKSPNNIKDADVSKYGDPKDIEVPIRVVSQNNDVEIPGVFALHKFIPTDDNSMRNHITRGNNNLKYLKQHLYNINPTNDTDAFKHLQEIVNVVSELAPV